MLGSDMAVLESGEVRTDLPCTVKPMEPVLSFDLKFHAGFDVTIPMRELAGNENLLTILFRVTPAIDMDNPTFFVQRVRVPKIEEDAKGEATIQGFFNLGEGSYRVDWLMRDRAERVCATNWNAEAALSVRDKQMGLALAPGMVARAETDFFGEEPPVARIPQNPISVKVLVNFAPSNPAAPQMRPVDTLALVSILRSIARDPRIGKFSVIAFNVQEQRVVYRQDGSDRIDFPAMGEALESIKYGTVDASRLAVKNGATDFLTQLIQQEAASAEQPDALIFAGPKVYLNAALPDEPLKALEAEVECPVFYLNYNLNPQAAPWRDSIGQAVKRLHGTEFTISRPRDLWNSTSEIVSRIVKSKQARSAAAGGGSH